MDGDREHEEDRGRADELGRSLEAALVFLKHKPDHGACDGEPGHERRPAVLEAIVELARIAELERDPGQERGREEQRAQDRREHRETARERECQRPEARGAARLRDRDEVGERDEQERHEHHRGHCEEATEHVRRPAPPQSEPGERHEEERSGRDRACPSEDLRRQAVARIREDVELTRVLLESPLQLALAGRM